MEPEILEPGDVTQTEEAAKALEKELNRFNEGLPYNRDRVIEKTQKALKTGVLSYFEAGCGMILLHDNEGDTYTPILEKYFPGVSADTAKKWRKFARAMAGHSQFRAFISERGGYSIGLTLIESLSQSDMQELEETGEVHGLTWDKIAKMSVRQLQKALLKAKEDLEKAVAKATEKTTQENSRLKEENETLKAALAEPGVESVIKVIRLAEDKLLEVVKLIRKIPKTILVQEQSLRQMVFGTTGNLARLLSDLEQLADEANNEAVAAEAGE